MQAILFSGWKINVQLKRICFEEEVVHLDRQFAYCLFFHVHDSKDMLCSCRCSLWTWISFLDASINCVIEGVEVTFPFPNFAEDSKLYFEFLFDRNCRQQVVSNYLIRDRALEVFFKRAWTFITHWFQDEVDEHAGE